MKTIKNMIIFWCNAAGCLALIELFLGLSFLVTFLCLINHKKIHCMTSHDESRKFEVEKHVEGSELRYITMECEMCNFEKQSGKSCDKVKVIGDEQ